MSDELEMRIRQAAANYAALSPLDRAIHDAEQRRSFVRGQTGQDPGPDVLATENARLTAELVEARERERVLREALQRAEWFLARSFAVLDLMAGDGLSMAGADDPVDILCDYEFTFDSNASGDEARAALAARALAPKP